MPFPDSRRVIYKKNPLEQVICQLRFPTILRIDSEIPAAFQERVRKDYPLFEEKLEGSISIPQEIVQQLPSGIADAFPRGNRAYNFASDDNLWVVTLTKEFLALTSSKYERWEQFEKNFEGPLHALLDIYSPAFFSRIGLRYQNVIRKSELGLEHTEWSDLLKPYIAGELAAPETDIKLAITQTLSQVVIKLQDRDSQVRVAHGLVEDSDTKESCYLIDSDFFTEQRTEIENATDLLGKFNQRNRRLFRWCITDRLHEAMGPQLL